MKIEDVINQFGPFSVVHVVVSLKIGNVEVRGLAKVVKGFIRSREYQITKVIAAV